MRSIIPKPGHLCTRLHGIAAPATGTPFAAYAAEYRRAMLAARRVERMAGHLDQAALLLKQDYAARDR